MWQLLGLLLGLSNSTTSSVNNSMQLAEMSCRIAQSQSAQITYIYRCVTCPLREFELELALQRCVGSSLPTCMRSLEAHELEPLRQTDSMNIFLIPAGDAGEPLVRRIHSMLNPQQQRRHFHKYLFVWPGAKEQQLKQLFEGCWEKYLLFGLAITHEGIIYDFDPFGVGGLQLTVLSSSNYYVDKLRNLRGYELRYSMFKQPLRAIPRHDVETEGYEAIDGSLASLIARRLNATARYVEPLDDDAYGRCLRNGSFTGVVADLMNGKTHIGLNLRFVLDCIWPLVEHTYPYSRSIIVLVVPAAQMKPEYLIFLTAFHESVWYLLVVNFLIAFALFGFFQRVLRVIKGEAGGFWDEIFEMLYKTHLGQPVERFSRISSLRTFLMGWIMFSYVLTTIYFGKLESSFVQPAYEEQLDNLDGLPALRLRVHGVNTMFQAVNSSLSERHYKLLTARRRVHPLKDTDHFFELAISRRRRAAFLMRDDRAREFLAITYNGDAGRPSYHIVKQYLRSMPSTYIMPLGSPFLYKFQGLMSSFYEHGIFEYWTRRDVLDRSRSSQSDEFFEDLGDQTDLQTESAADSQERRKKRVVLTMEILQGAFYLWIIGIGFSFLGFLLELGYYLWRNAAVVIV